MSVNMKPGLKKQYEHLEQRKKSPSEKVELDNALFAMLIRTCCYYYYYFTVTETMGREAAYNGRLQFLLYISFKKDTIFLDIFMYFIPST